MMAGFFRSISISVEFSLSPLNAQLVLPLAGHSFKLRKARTLNLEVEK